MIHENIYMHDVIDIFDVYQKDDLLKKSKLGLMKKWDTFSIIAIFLSIIALIGGSLWLVGLVSHEKSNNVDTAFMIAISGLVSIIINYYLNKKITEIILRKVFYSSKEKEFKLSRPMYINLVLLSDGFATSRRSNIASQAVNVVSGSAAASAQESDAGL